MRSKNATSVQFVGGWYITMTDSLGFLQYISRENKILQNNLKEYLYLFENKIYSKVREDEFEFNNQLKNTEKKFIDIKSKLDTNQIFKLNFTDEIGNYDFEKSSFPILWKSNGLQLLSDKWEFSTPEDINKNKIQLTDLRINFNNAASFSLLPIIQEKANFLIKKRKDLSGQVDRKIYMQIHFKIKEIKNGNDSGFKQTFIIGEKYLMCKILKIDFFEDKFPSYNFINSIGTFEF